MLAAAIIVHRCVRAGAGAQNVNPAAGAEARPLVTSFIQMSYSHFGGSRLPFGGAAFGTTASGPWVATKVKWLDYICLEYLESKRMACVR